MMFLQKEFNSNKTVSKMQRENDNGTGFEHLPKALNKTIISRVKVMEVYAYSVNQKTEKCMLALSFL